VLFRIIGRLLGTWEDRYTPENIAGVARVAAEAAWGPVRAACGFALVVVLAPFAATACSSSGNAGSDAGTPAEAGGSDTGAGADAPADDTGLDAGDTGVSPDDATSPADASHEAEAGPSPLGYMVGVKTNGVPTGPAKVESWLGRPLDVAGTTVTTTSYIGSGTPYTTAEGTYPLLEVSFPLLSIFGESNDLDDLAQAASGAYDATYTQMAEALAAWKNPLLSVRIGWEFNGNWYAWSNGVGTNATYANYIAAFQHAATIVKAKNPDALIQWCIAWGQPDPTPYWPGAYVATTNPGGVDVVSMDFYQANITQYNNGGTTSTWAMAQSVSASSGPIVLDWMITFAQAKGVKVALSEYGAGKPGSNGIGSGPGLDDGTWTHDSIAWMNSLPAGLFLWTDWSDDEPADDIVTAGANPQEQAAWTAAWEGTRYGGTWWKGAPPP
jgi:hypothetical protein